MNSHNNSGFTLLELLIVTGIVGMIISISVSYYEEYKKHAYDLVAQSLRDQAIIAIEARLDEREEQGLDKWANLNCMGSNCDPILGNYGFKWHNKVAFFVVNYFAAGDVSPTAPDRYRVYARASIRNASTNYQFVNVGTGELFAYWTWKSVSCPHSDKDPNRGQTDEQYC